MRRIAAAAAISRRPSLGTPGVLLVSPGTNYADELGEGPGGGPVFAFEHFRRRIWRTDGRLTPNFEHLPSKSVTVSSEVSVAARR
jgi:hypothetical protein